jgi:DNA repair ATPase RecN
MLLTLSIRNFVIVESLELEFAPGFTVLTGETGAGKSILIDALPSLANAAMPTLREGATRAEIAAEFRPKRALRPPEEQASRQMTPPCCWYVARSWAAAGHSMKLEFARSCANSANSCSTCTDSTLTSRC